MFDEPVWSITKIGPAKLMLNQKSLNLLLQNNHENYVSLLVCKLQLRFLSNVYPSMLQSEGQE